MSAGETLHERFARTVEDFAQNVAVVDPSTGDHFTYAELDRASDKIASALFASGVLAGDRVGMCVPKSARAVVALLGILKTGAAYVPVDAGSPPQRNAYIFSDCAVRCVIASEGATPALLEHGNYSQTALLEGGHVLLAQSLGAEPPSSLGLAYVLYTSGSTGSPKGVMLTHGNALSFVDWCIREFHPTPDDRFSSHAPFHFDLSILDLYLPLLSGAAIGPEGALTDISRPRFPCHQMRDARTQALCAPVRPTRPEDFVNRDALLPSGAGFPRP